MCWFCFQHKFTKIILKILLKINSLLILFIYTLFYIFLFELNFVIPVDTTYLVNIWCGIFHVINYENYLDLNRNTYISIVQLTNFVHIFNKRSATFSCQNQYQVRTFVNTKNWSTQKLLPVMYNCNLFTCM